MTIVTGRVPQAAAALRRPPPHACLPTTRSSWFAWAWAVPLFGNGCADAAHRAAGRAQRQLAALLAPPAVRRRPHPRPLQPELLHARGRPRCRSGTAAVGTFHSVFTPRGRLRDLVGCEPTRAGAQAPRRPRGRLRRLRPLPSTTTSPSSTWRVIPNGIDDEHFTPGAEPLSELREDGAPVILFLGRFDPRNGLGIMLEASSALYRERAGRRRLCVVGDGALRRDYQRGLPGGCRPAPSTGRDRGTGPGRATSPQPISSARPASGRASAWRCSRP